MIVYIAEYDDYDSWIGGVFATREAAEAFAGKSYRVTAYHVASSPEDQKLIDDYEQLVYAEERNPNRSKKRLARIAALAEALEQ